MHCRNKDNKTAEGHLRAAVIQNPTNLTDVYPLALAYYSVGNPPKPSASPSTGVEGATPAQLSPEVQDANVQGLFFIARAANLAAGTSGQAPIADFGRKWYIKYMLAPISRHFVPAVRVRAFRLKACRCLMRPSPS